MKKRKIRYTRVLVLVLGVLALILALYFALSSVFGGRKEKSASVAQTSGVQTAETAKEAAQQEEDTQMQIESIRNLEAAQLADISGLSTEQIRSLFYAESVSDSLAETITGVTYMAEQDFITLEQLQYIRVLYTDFNGDTRVGELIANELIAEDLVNIFYDLYTHAYPIDQMVLPDTFGGDDNANMVADNTNAFSFRLTDGYGIVEHEHSLGLAVDINPLYNPQVITTDSGQGVYPAEGSLYADRSQNLAHMINEDDYAYQVFTAYGFTWGGEWDGRNDYQHFEKYYEQPTQEELYRRLYGDSYAEEESAADEDATDTEEDISGQEE